MTTEFMLLMHGDAVRTVGEWGPYLAMLRASGCFLGGSAIGGGTCARKEGPTPPITAHLTGYVKVRAHDVDAARAFLAGNPVFEAGGTVEIRALPTE